MATMDEAALKSHLKIGIPSRVYFIYGEDDYLKQHYVGQIIKAVVGDAGNDFNLHRLPGKELDIDQLATAVDQLPLMSERKCVVVNDLDIAALPAIQHGKLLELLGDLPDTCVLILWYSGVIPSLSAAKVKSALELIKKAGNVVQLGHRDASTLAKMLCDGAKHRGSSLSAPHARMLLERCGSDLNLLMGELEKLSAYAQGREITPQDIERMAVRTLDSSAYDLVRAVNRQNADRAFSLLDELYTQKIEPVMILGAMASSYINMYRAKCAVVAGVAPAEFAKRLGARRPDSLKYAASDASRLDIAQLRQGLSILDRADRLLKTSRCDGRVVLEQAVTELMVSAKYR